MLVFLIQQTQCLLTFKIAMTTFRSSLQSAKNTLLEMQIFTLPKFFRWIKKTDNEESYCLLSDAIVGFLDDMNFLNIE